MSTIVTTGAATGSSGTTYISGASGFDSSALIAASVEARMQPAYRLDVQIAELEAEVAAYEEMLTLMTDLAGAAESLSGVSDGSVYETYAGYLTAPELDDPQRYLTATVTDGAGPGSYEIVVDQLAQGMKVASTEQSGETALGLAGTFNLAAAGYAGADISVTGDMSLSDMADTINAASGETGVVATMIRTSDRGYTLTLSTVDTGASLTASAVSGDDVLQALGFTDASGAFANQLQAAQDAVFTLDGVTVTSSSNEIEDLILGVSINHMTLKDFCELLDVHGSDLRKWPNDRRAAALTLLDRSDVAKKAFADACGFDAALLSDDDGLSDAHRQSLIDGIMQAVGLTEGQEEAPKTCPDQPGRETAAALPSRRLIELFAGFVPLAPDDPKGQPTRRDRIAEFLHGVIDSALQGPGRGDALAALAHRERA